MAIRSRRTGAATAAVVAWTLLGCFNWGTTPSDSEGCKPYTPTRPSSYADLRATDAAFGPVTIGKTATLRVYVTNYGNVATTRVTFDGIASSTDWPLRFAWAGGTAPGTDGTCGARLEPGASCSLVFTYAPESIGTYDTASLAGHYEPPPYTEMTEGTFYVPLSGSGTGTRPAEYAELRTQTVTFGRVPLGTAVRAVALVFNDGNSATTALSAEPLQAPFAWSGGAFPGTGGTCTSTLAAGGWCKLDLTFSPVVAESASAALRLHYLPAPWTQVTEGVAADSTGGEGVAGALPLTIAPARYDYGAIGTGTRTTASFTLTNATGAVLTIPCWASLAPGDAFVFDPGTCCPAAPSGERVSANLANGASCTFTVQFGPYGIGPYLSTLVYQVAGNSSYHQSNTVQLTGEGTLAR